MAPARFAVSSPLSPGRCIMGLFGPNRADKITLYGCMSGIVPDEILKGADFTIALDKIACIIGPNGA
jgi:ABC-type branched-subunit amino acid transport system ATPase component